MHTGDDVGVTRPWIKEDKAMEENVAGIAKVVNNSRETCYYVGDAINYTSMYGYPKRRYKVFQLDPGEQYNPLAHWVGEIKEERIADESGDCITTVFYEKNGWRRQGLIRFFASCEALLIACGKTPLYNRGDESEATDKIAKLSESKPIDTPPVFYLGNKGLASHPLLTGPEAAVLAGTQPKMLAPPRKRKSPARIGSGIDRPARVKTRAKAKKAAKKPAKKTKAKSGRRK
jgi:hypothetical protein